MPKALEIPIHQLFHDGESPIKKPNLQATKSDGTLWGASRKERRELRLFAKAL